MLRRSPARLLFLALSPVPALFPGQLLYLGRLPSPALQLPFLALRLPFLGRLPSPALPLPYRLRLQPLPLRCRSRP